MPEIAELPPVFDRWGRYLGKLKVGEVLPDPICEGCYLGDDELLGAVASRVTGRFWHDECWREMLDRSLLANWEPPKRYGQCTSCAAPIYLLWTEGGARAMIDVAPVADGRLVFVLAGIVRYVTSAERAALPAEVRQYASHFDTCPARYHSKQKREHDKKA